MRHCSFVTLTEQVTWEAARPRVRPFGQFQEAQPAAGTRPCHRARACTGTGPGLGKGARPRPGTPVPRAAASPCPRLPIPENMPRGRAKRPAGSKRLTSSSSDGYHVAMDISSKRLCKFHMKELKLINSFELRGDKSAWAAATTCLFPARTGGLGAREHADWGVWSVNPTRATLCACLWSGHRPEGGSAQPKGQRFISSFLQPARTHVRSRAIFILV